MFQLEIQDGSHGGQLENIFFASSPEPKGQLTRNFVGRIGVTGRSKIAKIVPIGKCKMVAMVAILKILFFSLHLQNPKVS